MATYLESLGGGRAGKNKPVYPVDTKKLEGQMNIWEGGLQLAQGISDYGTAIGESYLSKTAGKEAKREAFKEAALFQQAGKALRGQNTANAAASGIDPSTGSAKLIDETLVKRIESDVSQKLLEGNVANINAKFQANQQKLAGRSALAKGLLSAGSSFYSGYQKGAFEGIKWLR